MKFKLTNDFEVETASIITDNKKKETELIKLRIDLKKKTSELQAVLSNDINNPNLSRVNKITLKKRSTY